jgi:hypothetical protein
MSYLLGAGAYVDSWNSREQTPLMSAANGEVSMMLLQHGANVNAATRLG